MHPVPARSVPRMRADGWLSGISAWMCTVAGSARLKRPTAAFTPTHASLTLVGTQARSVRIEPVHTVGMRYDTDTSDRTRPLESLEQRPIVGCDGEEAPRVGEATDHEAFHRRALAIVDDGVGLDRRSARRVAR